MTDHEYAAVIYCQVFPTDDGDAYARGILSAVAELNEREQFALECRFRHGMPPEQIEEMTGIRAGVINIVLRKLRHKIRAQQMSIKKMTAKRGSGNERTAEMRDKIIRLQTLVFKLMRDIDIALDEDREELCEACAMDISELGFPARIVNALQREGYHTLAKVYAIDSYEQLRRVRNIGVKLLGDLIARMRELGFTDWADKIEATKKKEI